MACLRSRLAAETDSPTALARCADRRTARSLGLRSRPAQRRPAFAPIRRVHAARLPARKRRAHRDVRASAVPLQKLRMIWKVLALDRLRTSTTPIKSLRAKI